MLSFKTYGYNTNPAILFLHGLFGSKDDFHFICHQLSDGYYCIAIDLPGFGLSPIQFSDCLKQEIDNGLLYLIQHLSLSKFHLAGYSLGGRLSLEFFHKHPDLVLSLMILSANIGINDGEKLKKQKENSDLIDHIQNLSPTDFLQNWYRSPLFCTLNDKPLLKDLIIQKRSSYNKKVVSWYLSELSIHKQSDFHFLLPKITHGVFFYGECDVYYKKQYNTITLYNPSLKVEEIQDASHAVVEESSALVSNKMRYFLENLDD